MLANTRRFSAYSVYLTYSFVYGLAFTTAAMLNQLYELETAKFNPLQLVLVGTILEITCFLCQVPTGVLADLYSRRLSIIVGTLLLGVGFILEGSIPQFWAIASGMVLLGVGVTFVSGAQEAWVADELGEKSVGRAFLRGSQISQIGNILGAFISVALASLWLGLPTVVGGVLIVLLGLVQIFVMPEHGFRPTPKEERQSWRGLANVFGDGLRVAWRNPMLLLILGVGLFYGLSSEGFDRFWAAHMQLDFQIPMLGPFQAIVWFGIISVLGDLLVIGVTEVVQWRFNMNNQRIMIRILVVLNVLGMLGLLTFALTSNFFLAIVAVLCVNVFRGVKDPIRTTWLTKNTESRVRATLVSLDGQMDALGQIAGGPPIGYLGTVYSLRVGLAAVSVILAPVMLLYALALRRLHQLSNQERQDS